MNNKHYTIFTGCYNSDNQTNLWKIKINYKTGAFFGKEAYGSFNNPSWLGWNRGLYIQEEVSKKSGGRLIYGDHTIPIEGEDSCHLEISKDEFIVSSYSGGSITYGSFKDRLGKVLSFYGSGPDPERQESSHPHFSLFSPCRRFILTADLGTDSIYIIDKESLSVLEAVKTQGGAGPRHMVFAGDYLYVANELNSTLSCYKWNNTTLSHIKSVSSRSNPVATKNYPGGIIWDSKRDLLYISNRGDNDIVAFDISRRENPTESGSIKSGGEWPRTLGVTPDFRFLISLNQVSGEVSSIYLGGETLDWKFSDSIILDKPVGVAIKWPEPSF